LIQLNNREIMETKNFPDIIIGQQLGNVHIKLPLTITFQPVERFSRTIYGTESSSSTSREKWKLQYVQNSILWEQPGIFKKCPQH
jgi:hypothetical protein